MMSSISGSINLGIFYIGSGLSVLGSAPKLLVVLILLVQEIPTLKARKF